MSENWLFDLESSVNIHSNTSLHPFDTVRTDGKFKLYRFWTRFSTRQLEIRLGLQKINFGSASLIRPLMWFDQLDARDPLGLTDGVWAFLGRYYFLNNNNIWFWVLYGNKNPMGWELIKVNKKYPEIGGRVQVPIPTGEAGLSYHYRVADSRKALSGIRPVSKIPEHRIGIDTRWDLLAGCWFEASWTFKERDLDEFTNQEILNAGMDYTFNLGSGLYMVLEHIYFSYDTRPFDFDNTLSFSVMSLSYPFGIFDNLSSIVYYDWKNIQIYNILNWQRQYDTFTFHLLGFWNPETNQLHSQRGAQNMYSGKGIQFMLVFNH
jgi:hypothetical protein